MSRDENLMQALGYLNGAVSNIRLYAADHPQVARYLARAHSELQSIFMTQADVTIILVDDDAVVDNHAMDNRSPQLAQFVQTLQQCAIERVSFTTDLDLDQLRQFVGELASSDEDVIHSTPGIRLGKVQVGQAADDQSAAELLEPEVRQRLAELALFRDHSLDELKGVYDQIRATRQISPHGLGEMVQGFLQGMLRNVSPLKMLATLKTSDEYTFTHAINVCILTMAQAEFLGVRGQKLHEVGVAASLHDAGKMFVPDEILNKPDKLTDREWEHMRDHAQHGAQYILRLDGIPKMAFLAALEHHIRYDGTGYPDLGKDWRPTMVSQMIAVADFFDAMRSRRPYKDPKPDELIIKILREESGTSFNPHLVDNFLRLIKVQS